MTGLIFQDTFEPYYAGREDEAERDKPRRQSKMHPEPGAEGEIILPGEPPPPASEVRRDRRPVAH
jgi:hypothetical protein